MGHRRRRHHRRRVRSNGDRCYDTAKTNEFFTGLSRDSLNLKNFFKTSKQLWAPQERRTHDDVDDGDDDKDVNASQPASQPAASQSRTLTLTFEKPCVSP